MELKDVVAIAKKLSINDQKRLIAVLKKDASCSETKVDEYLSDERFANGRACPCCGSAAVSKNGHQKDGTQRYICKDCGKSFVSTTNSITSGTRKRLYVWEKYIECMMLGLSLRKTAMLCKIHRNTAFAWRHKILDVLQEMADGIVLDGIVEADETFFAVSYKGNHKNSKTFTMPRPAHTCGKKSKKRGISGEKVCVPCAVNRNGLCYARLGNLGRVANKDLHFVFDNHIQPGATMCTDAMNAYRAFASESSVKLVQSKGKESRCGEYNIQRVNNYHQQLGKFLESLGGVSSKYLNNYIVWHSFRYYTKNGFEEKQEILLRFAFVTPKKITNNQLSNRNPLPVAC